MLHLIPMMEGARVVDGQFIGAIDYCKRHCASSECKSFYDRIQKDNYNKFISCPHGMSVFVKFENETKWIFTSMREKSTYEKSKAKKISNNEEIVYNPLLEAKQLLDLINYSITTELEAKKLNEKQASIDSISHEVKKLNAQVKDRSDAIIQTYGTSTANGFEASCLHEILEKAKTIYVCSSIINSRFSMIDYEKNPQVLQSGSKQATSIYKKFDKMRIIFSNYLGRKVPIQLEGSAYVCINAYPSFEIIPLLLIDNAVKYSGPGWPVIIRFDTNNGGLSVCIQSYGPYCSQADLEKIFQKGFRGKNAVRVADGNGIGLFFAKMLCELHDISISVSSDSTQIKESGGIAYAPFVVNLKFSNTFPDPAYTF